MGQVQSGLSPEEVEGKAHAPAAGATGESLSRLGTLGVNLGKPHGNLSRSSSRKVRIRVPFFL